MCSCGVCVRTNPNHESVSVWVCSVVKWLCKHVVVYCVMKALCIVWCCGVGVQGRHLRQNKNADHKCMLEAIN